MSTPLPQPPRRAPDPDIAPTPATPVHGTQSQDPAVRAIAASPAVPDDATADRTGQDGTATLEQAAAAPPQLPDPTAGQAPRPVDPKLAPQVAAVEAARRKLVADIDVLDDEVRLEVLYRMESFAWKAVAGVAAAVAGLAATKLLNVVWDKLVPDSHPPEDPTDPDTPARDALVWTALTGLGVGLATVFAQRGAARGWTKATGQKPPAFTKTKGPVGRK